MPEFTPVGKVLRCTTCGMLVAVDPQLHACSPVTLQKIAERKPRA